MDTIYSLLKRAKELKEKSQVDSITPEEVGKLHEDTLAYISSLEQSTDGLGIKKVYQSKSAMEADTDPVGTNGKALHFGQLVSIYDDAHADSSENGNIYAFQKPGWLLMGKVSGGAGLSIAQEAGDSATSVMSQAAVTKALKGISITTDDGKSLQEVYDIARRAKQMIRLDASLISGGYIKTNGTTTDYSVINDRVYSYAVKDVVEGDTFLIQGKSGVVGALFAFVDAGGNILSRSDVSNSVKNYEAVAPQGATKIIIQGDPSTTHVFMKSTKGYELYDAIKSSLIESQRYTFSKGFMHSSGTVRTSNDIPLCISGFIKIPRWAKKIAVTIAKSQYMKNQTGLGFFNGNRLSIDVKVYPYGINQSVMTVYDIPTNAEYLRATFFDGIPNIGRFELYFINDENEEQIRCLVDRYNAVHVRSRDIFIAASEATDQEKEIAHYVCDGTNDTDIIQEVINLLMQSSFKGGV